LKKTHHKKRAGGGPQGIGPEFKPQHLKNKIIKKFLKEKKNPLKSHFKRLNFMACELHIYKQ
jgi:hypothetical protein